MAVKEMGNDRKSQHQIMVEGLVKYLIKDGYINIKADISGFDPPDNIYTLSKTNSFGDNCKLIFSRY
jgi:hypothetical protein